MKNTPHPGRRMFVKSLSLTGLGLTALGPTTAITAEAAMKLCRVPKTPAQPEGPFYPVHDRLDKDNDLTRVSGRVGQALGKVVYVEGVVQDQACNPVQGALVEVWQACASGKYDHPGDTANPAPLDEKFQYWGQALSDENGRYLFKTIIPGSYAAGEGWVRPPHIHFKVSRKGYLELITQMYFAGQALNERDLILQRLSAPDRQRVVVEFHPPTSAEYEPDSLIGEFNLGIEKL